MRIKNLIERPATRTWIAAALLLASGSAMGQGTEPEGEGGATAPEADVTADGSTETGTPADQLTSEDPPSGFEGARLDIERQLEESIQELADVQAALTREKLPLSRRLGELEAELTRVRSEAIDAMRRRDSSNFQLSTLTSGNKARRDEVNYLSNLLGEYVRNFESRLHVAELARYDAVLERATLAVQNESLAEREAFDAQSAVVSMAIDRLDEAIGGVSFEGQAVGSDKLVHDGQFVLLGPTALFVSADGLQVGTAEKPADSTQPTVLGFQLPEDVEVAKALVGSGSGMYPIDTTLGRAHKIAESDSSFFGGIEDGGAVMIPILVMAGLALLVAILKLLSLVATSLAQPSQRRVRGLLELISKGESESAERSAAKMGGPIGRMLAVGTQHLGEPRELIEEAMYESVLKTKLKVQSFLPFIAICAASAPLLGLLGTVTGIINTFEMIQIDGSGNVKSLSGGISEALITTKFGLIVAIPSLLLHAFLSRMAKGVVDRMEGTGISFVNEVSRSTLEPAARHARTVGEGPADGSSAVPADADAVRAQVSQILNDLLAPLAEESEALQASNRS